MENRIRKNTALATIILSIAAVIILTITGFAARDREYKPSSWVLKAYGNSVALYNGESVDTVYGGIVLSNLPEEDIDILKTGISFPTKKEALAAIEDYDG